MIVTLEDIEKVQKQLDRLKARCVDEDQFKDLKKAYSEGAIIEYLSEDTNWYSFEKNEPGWYKDFTYRIKNNISIESWNKHKDLIKQWWDGVEIEVEDIDGWWNVSMNSPLWEKNKNYRVKDKWKLPEYEDGSTSTIDVDGVVRDIKGKEITKAGRRRTTEELAERTAKASKTRDLLEAYRDHLEPGWADNEYVAYYISKTGSRYYACKTLGARILGGVYMNKDTAEQICAKLNDGTISLD